MGIARDTGDPAIDAHVRTRLGEVFVRRDALEQAREQASLADERARGAGADSFRIDALACLADCCGTERAQEAVRTAIRISEELGDPGADQLRTRLAELGS